MCIEESVLLWCIQYNPYKECGPGGYFLGNDIINIIKTAISKTPVALGFKSYLTIKL